MLPKTPICMTMFGMLTLFMSIDDEFEVKFTPDDMLSDNSKTIDGITNIIFNRLHDSD